MPEQLTKYLAVLMLLFMLGLAYYSMIGNSLTFDESAHLPAGYSYIVKHDMRLNPEHPPLIKDLSGLSILLWLKLSGTPINFPDQISAWNQDINGQWEFGANFLYKYNSAITDLIIFTGRLPMLLILLLLGIYIFRWAKELWGNGAALLSLFLFSLSPTFIAHAQFVTTDVAAAAGVFISTFYFVRWLKNPNDWNLINAILFFGLAQLIKFSLFLLVPFFGLLVIIKIILKIFSDKKITSLPPADIGLYDLPKQSDNDTWSIKKILMQYLGGFIFIIFFGYAFVVIPVYYFHIKNYPAEKQKVDIRCTLQNNAGGPLDINKLKMQSADWCKDLQIKEKPLAACKSISRMRRCPADFAIWTSGKAAPLRSFGQYIYGLVMVFQRAAGGNTTYFMGKISVEGWHSYFPLMYLSKEPLSLHVLTLLAIYISIYYLRKKRSVQKFGNLPEANFDIRTRFFLWLNRNFEIVAMIIFLIVYWVNSASSRLNIGVRHLLPAFPFIYVLIASRIALIIKEKTEIKYKYWLKIIAIFLILTWQIISVVAVYPSFLAYYNEAAGGPSNGYKIAVDSNLDWGQDLKRLQDFADENKISKIYIDYFGGGSPVYYLNEKFQPWWGQKNPDELKSGDWLAISATLLQGGRARQGKGFTQPTDYYRWLDKYEPVTKIGYSIFVYKIP